MSKFWSVTSKNDADERAQRQLEYVARRSISRYGCFGCHDIPGYETAKPIGTPLASWGRKDPSQLAFENIGQFLATHGEFMPTRSHGTRRSRCCRTVSTRSRITPGVAGRLGAIRRQLRTRACRRTTASTRSTTSSTPTPVTSCNR